AAATSGGSTKASVDAAYTSTATNPAVDSAGVSNPVDVCVGAPPSVPLPALVGGSVEALEENSAASSAGGSPQPTDARRPAPGCVGSADSADAFSARAASHHSLIPDGELNAELPSDDHARARSRTSAHHSGPPIGSADEPDAPTTEGADARRPVRDSCTTHPLDRNSV
ncbi:hypothetical protein, partial [Planotetraspora thailandica]|uniref:hypothetical protein n=1 Tax=Planotetraspora thailandica TaxID=487172 RepID=UPI0019503AB0